ncbi:MAG: TfoX/Sxy family protein [Roseicyclus sp.]|nr:TfoX/Sxy family protein [Roseicyclus sp.]
MSISDEDTTHVSELFEGLGDITTRKMFGALGLYHDGKIFSLFMSDGALMLKGAGAFQDELDAAGCTRWTYSRPGKKEVAMPYWSMPDVALDDPTEAVAWAPRALAYL